VDRKQTDANPPRRSRRIKHERSAGGLVLKRENGAYEGLLIGRSSPRIWSFPKGHVEPSEAIEDAAVREVLEETAIEAAIIEKLSDIRYWFYSNKVKHSKVVHFFLMRYLGGTPAPQAGEVDETVWAPLGELPGVLTHLNERRLVGLAQRIVDERTPAELGFLDRK
jgi:8-oxo-dGTP pyrophosphatase MutT (NUDIX family)